MLSKINKKNRKTSCLNNFWWKATRPQPRHLTGMPTKLSIQRFSGQMVGWNAKQKTKKLKIHSSLRVTALDSDIPSLKECCHWQCQGVYERNIYLAVSQPVRCCTLETEKLHQLWARLLRKKILNLTRQRRRHGVGGHSYRKTTEKMCCSLLRPLMHDQSHQHLQYLLHLRHWGPENYRDGSGEKWMPFMDVDRGEFSQRCSCMNV